MSQPADIEIEINTLLARIREQREGDILMPLWHELVAMGAPAVPHLIALLDSPDAVIRAAAAKILGEIGDIRAYDPLLAMLQTRHDSPDDRGSAALALGSLSDVRAIDPLREALRDGDARVRWGAIYGLGLLHNPAVFEPVSSALYDSDPVIRRCAVEILGERFESEGFKMLVAALKDPDRDVARTAANLLYRNTHWREMEYSRDETEQIRFQMWQAASAKDDD